MLQALSIDADYENLSIDSTYCKVRQRANGGKKSENKAVGISKGGRNAKIHALVDGLGNPLAFLFSPGPDHDSVHTVELLRSAADPWPVDWHIYKERHLVEYFFQ